MPLCHLHLNCVTHPYSYDKSYKIVQTIDHHDSLRYKIILWCSFRFVNHVNLIWYQWLVEDLSHALTHQAHWGLLAKHYQAVIDVWHLWGYFPLGFEGQRGQFQVWWHQWPGVLLNPCAQQLPEGHLQTLLMGNYIFIYSYNMLLINSSRSHFKRK